MEQVLSGLARFRAYTGTENHLGDFVTNALDEVIEVRKAYLSGDINHVVEEFTDICVYCFNAIAQTGGKYSKWDKFGATIPDSVDKVTCYVGQMICSIGIHNSYDRLSEVINFIGAAIKQLGYDFEKCIMETVNKINSRKGAINEVTLKWEKDINQSKGELYKPNYEKCKL